MRASVLGYERKCLERSVLRTRGFQFAFNEVKFAGMQHPEIACRVLFNGGTQFWCDPWWIESRQREMRGESALFGRKAERSDLLIDSVGQRSEILRRLHATPNDTRAIRVREEADVTKDQANLLRRVHVGERCANRIEHRRIDVTDESQSDV